MHGPLEKQPRDAKSAYRNWDIGLDQSMALLTRPLVMP